MTMKSHWNKQFKITALSEKTKEPKFKYQQKHSYNSRVSQCEKSSAENGLDVKKYHRIKVFYIQSCLKGLLWK